MNERLKQLAAQAGFLGEDLDKTVFGTCHSTALENFAELILEECLTVASYGGEFVSRPKLVEQLKNHFGVEE